MRHAVLGRLLLALFVVSGLAGLIYQSIWSHYLGLVLGHAAYAQTLVLAIFMGGMALGAWLASRRSASWRHLILAYAVIELVIGLIGLVFHPGFVAYVDFSQGRVLPTLGSPALAHGYQWITGALLMVPQSVLLGMTFPLLSAGYLRLVPGQPGEVLGGLYFTNSLGAALGALATAFILLPILGMPGTMLTAGLLNIAVGIGAWAVWKMVQADPVGDEGAVATAGKPARAATPDEDLPRLSRIVLVAAFITGATSFIYEIAWIRLLNQALGTTIHSFELMLAAFILGLAFGGYWVRQHAARIADAIRYAAYAQVLMGLAALFSVVVLARSFHWVGWLMSALSRNDAGYDLYSTGSAAVALAVMFPAAFFAGMTLPLFTTALLRKGGGEKQIGRVYASNTLGAIVGVLLVVHVLVPLMGVRMAIVLSALVDAGLGLYLLRYVSPARRTVGYAVAGVATLMFTCLTMFLGKHDPEVLASGVFRNARVRLHESVKVPFFRDGKTATVSVAVAPDGVVNIATNGKSDASMTASLDQPARSDEITMIMAAALPLALHPSPENIAVIGWGSGLTTHTLMGSSIPARVDTIEIEKAMYDGARLFGGRVERAYKDPRSHLHIDDARTYFAMGNRKFDAIISEPSNPWVSGVASLFTEEFYRFLRSHLKEDGMLVQWVQAYELNDELLATMIAALLKEFPDSDLYVTNTSDLLIVGYTGSRTAPNWSALAETPLAAELARVGLNSPSEFALRRLGGGEMLKTYVSVADVRPHSDFYPVVALNAPRSRFKAEQAVSLFSVIESGLPVAELLGGRLEVPASGVSPNQHSRFTRLKTLAAALRDGLLTGEPKVESFGEDRVLLPKVLALLRLSAQPVKESDLLMWSWLVSDTAALTLGPLPESEQEGVWVNPAWIAREGQPAIVTDVVDALGATARREPEAMLATAMKVLAYPEANRLSSFLREQMLLQAQLGAIGSGQPALVEEIQKKHGEDIPESARYAYVRKYVRVWALGQVASADPEETVAR
ncbi:fused MFS/spermidine synthase [Pseudoxanthomonas mexicana]